MTEFDSGAAEAAEAATADSAANAEVCRLAINGVPHLPVAGAMAGESAAMLGVSADDAARLRVITSELAAAVVESSFEPGDDVAIEVSVQRRPAASRLSSRMSAHRRGLPSPAVSRRGWVSCCTWDSPMS